MTDFRDFNFKLLVVEKLMYQDETLKPAFDLSKHMWEHRAITDVDGYVWDNDLAYTVLDEPRAYFQELKIPADLLATVDELTFDGGLDVFAECAPVWDGEDDLFDIHSLDDLDLLPNLKLFRGTYALKNMVPGSLEILAARGIAASD